jgi:ribosome maturation factor RimP
MALDVERVREIAERVGVSSGLEIVDVEFLGGGKARMLRVFLDKPLIAKDGAAENAANTDLLSGVTHEDCAKFSREFGTIVEVEGVIAGSYTLEVSSPGLDRRLTKAADFKRFTGSRMKVMTREPIDSSRHFEGRLESFQDGRITLDLSVASSKSRKKMGEAAGKKIEIDLVNVEKANLVPEL